MKKQVSVVVPIYNVEMYLSRCLDSILCQSLTCIEVLCIDDSSTDESRRVIEEYKTHDDRIVAIFNERNMGLSYSRNRGLDIAQGEYVWFIDSDDFLTDSNALDHMYKLAQSNKLDVLLINLKSYFEDGNTDFINSCTDWEPRCGYNGVFTGEDLFFEQIKESEFTSATPTYFFKKQFLDICGVHFPILYHEDMFFSVATLLKAKRVMHLPQAYYGYYRRKGSITRGGDWQTRLENLAEVWFLLLDYLEEIDISSKGIEAFEKYMLIVESEIIRVFIDGLKCGVTPQFANIKNKVLFDLVGRKNFPLIWESIDEIFISRITESRNIILYGSGVVGQTVKTLLSYLGISNYVVVTTSGDGGTIPMRELRDSCKDWLVIIATIGEKSKEMRQYAFDLGFKSILTIK